MSSSSSRESREGDRALTETQLSPSCPANGPSTATNSFRQKYCPSRLSLVVNLASGKTSGKQEEVGRRTDSSFITSWAKGGTLKMSPVFPGPAFHLPGPS